MTAATGESLALAALSLVGLPFRFHGRIAAAQDPARGLDCVGVVEAALARAGHPAHLPTGYALRHRDLPGLDEIARALGLQQALGPVAHGDVLLLRPSPCQMHLAIATGPATMVHAHAGLRRVVSGPLPPEWPQVCRWRLPPMPGNRPSPRTETETGT